MYETQQYAPPRQTYDTTPPGAFGQQYPAYGAPGPLQTPPQTPGQSGQAGAFTGQYGQPSAFGGPNVAPNPATMTYDPENPETAAGYFFDPAMNPYTPSANQNWAQQGVINHNLNGLPPDPMSNAGFGLLDKSIGAAYGILNDGGGQARDAQFSASGTEYQPGSSQTARIDPARAIAAAQSQMRSITSPQVRAAMQAGGMGRSGAEAEALANAGVNLELPIAQQVLGADRGANELDAQMKSQAQMHALGLTAQSANTAMGIGGQLAAGNADRALSASQTRRSQDIGLVGGLNSLGNNLAMGIPALQASQFAQGNEAWKNIVGATNAPQNSAIAGNQNWQNYILSLMGANPIPPGGTTTGTQTSPQSTDWLGLIGGLASTAGAASRWM
jgi:hypothetical protein